MRNQDKLISGWLQQLANLRAAAAFGAKAQVQFDEASRAFHRATGKDPEPLIEYMLPSKEISAAIIELDDAI